MNATTGLPTAQVHLVAAGPGDPGLLTVCAVDRLHRAEVIVTDPECEALARAHARAEAEVVVAVDEDGQVADHVDRVRLVIDPAGLGRAVVRLMAGDPVLDGSLALEAGALAEAGITYDIAPGVSTVTGSAAYAGFALTGGRAREVRVVDAHDPEVEWAGLADPHATVVVLDGAERALDICRLLVLGGRDPRTPVAITRNSTTVDQRSILSTLADVASAIKAAKGEVGPGVLVVGEVVGQCQQLAWFENKPLFGWRVLVPRTKEQAGSLSEQLRSYGAVPVEVPTISVEPPRTPQQMERAVHGLVSGRYQWVAFTSANAVRAVKERFDQYGLDSRAFAGLKVAAVGEQTAAALRAFGIVPDLVPSGEQSSAGLLEEFPGYDAAFDPIDRVFLPRADIATETLAAGLAELGWEVDDVTAYRTVRAAPPAAEIREAIKGGGFDAVLFTSSSTVRNLVGIAGKPHSSTVVACIGPQTAKTAEENGLRVDVLPETPSVAALAAALAGHGEALRRHAIEHGETAWRPGRRRGGSRRKAT
ncbi:MAG: bifunctional uroporphyrinogen-III C-methyltransferase/uroporphyrinogen-III synthase [Candidatus Nanopelagicales bacterium]|jgi:uroporphyrinogen III methyltransferase/synthase|nr:bifunctional uroporphyrinogen-III C-methyltransferase/uroporphyrinogen-III synthase [Candidatus Nanopelagicales bacterium]